MTVSLIGLTCGALLLTFLNLQILIVGIVAILGLLTYTHLKRTWWGGPPWNAWIVALLPLMGRLVDGEYGVGSMLHCGNNDELAFSLAVAAVFFGYANFVIMGYFKDISADRKTGYRTFPVVFGWRPAAIYSDTTAATLALLVGMVLVLSHHVHPVGVVLYFTAMTINVHAQIAIHRTRDETMAHAPIANVVRSFILYCLAIIVTMQQGWAILMVVFYALFELALKVRPERTQV
jgi:4-hydroxybenzoate polyprenyltransferase